MGLKQKASHLILVATAANFINVIAPTAGIGGMAVFMEDAKREDHPSGRVTVVGCCISYTTIWHFFAC